MPPSAPAPQSAAVRVVVPPAVADSPFNAWVVSLVGYGPLVETDALV